MSSDLTFVTNEAGKSLRDRFAVLLAEDTRFFDCLVGYFFISGFYKLYPSLTKTEKIAEHVIVMDEGRIIAQGKPNEVLEKPEIIEAYVA